MRQRVVRRPERLGLLQKLAGRVLKTVPHNKTWTAAGDFRWYKAAARRTFFEPLVSAPPRCAAAAPCDWSLRPRYTSSGSRSCSATSSVPTRRCARARGDEHFSGAAMHMRFGDKQGDAQSRQAATAADGRRLPRGRAAAALNRSRRYGCRVEVYVATDSARAAAAARAWGARRARGALAVIVRDAPETWGATDGARILAMGDERRTLLADVIFMSRADVFVASVHVAARARRSATRGRIAMGSENIHLRDRWKFGEDEGRVPAGGGGREPGARLGLGGRPRQ